MKQSEKNYNIWDEIEFLEQLLKLDGKSILDLGCGKAEITRLIATNGDDRQVTAAEIDEVQLSKNLLIDDLPNVTFINSGSESIPLEDESIDVAFMFKSLHHVPIDLMGNAFNED